MKMILKWDYLSSLRGMTVLSLDYTVIYLSNYIWKTVWFTFGLPLGCKDEKTIIFKWEYTGSKPRPGEEP